MIRLNLLAEAQAAEDLRRRDPAKRVIWVGALLVALMLMWSASLFLKGMLAKSSVSAVQTQINTRTNQYQRVRDNQKKLGEIKFKLDALNRLTTNRFLNGSLLNALQRHTVADVQLVHLRVDQNYVQAQETQPSTNETRVIPGRPATATEKIVLTLEGSDSSLNPGDQVSIFRDILAKAPYFRQLLGKTNNVTLKQQSATQVSPETAKACVMFTLEGQGQERTRQ